MAVYFIPEGAGPFPVVVILHGTMGLREIHVQLAQDYAESGFIAIAGSWFGGHYKAVGSEKPPVKTEHSDDIDWPDGPEIKRGTHPEAVEDVVALVEAARTLPTADPSRIGLYGHSRGSEAAIATAASGVDIQAAVAIAGYPTNISFRKLEAPILILQGTVDKFVGPAKALQFEETLIALGKTVMTHIIKGAPHDAHTTLPWSIEVLNTASSFYSEYLENSSYPAAGASESTLPAPTATQTQPTEPPAVPAIVGTVSFQVDVQEVTTASQLSMGSIVGPCLIRLKDGRYRLYLQARALPNQTPDGVNIVSLISTDGKQWDVEPGIRIQHGSQSDVDFEAGEPGVHLGLDDKYYMTYTGRQSNPNKDNLLHKVVFAVSDDGLSWVKLNRYYADPQNRNDFASSADVNFVNGQYVIYYTGGTNVIRATSQDGLAWVRQEIAFDAGHDTTMVKYSGSYYMFAKMPESLKYARKSDMVGGWDDHKSDLLVMAVSDDGVSWSKDYYRVVVENKDGGELSVEDLEDPGSILLPDGSLRIFLNNKGGNTIFSIKPTTPLPKP